MLTFGNIFWCPTFQFLKSFYVVKHMVMKSECGLTPLITIVCEKCTEPISFKNSKKIGLTKIISEKINIFFMH